MAVDSSMQELQHSGSSALLLCTSALHLYLAPLPCTSAYAPLPSSLACTFGLHLCSAPPLCTSASTSGMHLCPAPLRARLPCTPACASGCITCRTCPVVADMLVISALGTSVGFHVTVDGASASTSALHLLGASLALLSPCNVHTACVCVVHHTVAARWW